jgi:hypothetical protein
VLRGCFSYKENYNNNLFSEGYCKDALQNKMFQKNLEDILTSLLCMYHGLIMDAWWYFYGVLPASRVQSTSID